MDGSIAALLLGLLAASASVNGADLHFRAERLLDAPIVAPASHPGAGENIQGPSLIRVPEWVPNALGGYYLYFADHKGRYIRLAHADALTGPWRLHEPGSLHLEGSGFPTQAPTWTEAEAEAVRDRVRSAGLRLPHDPLLDMTVPHIASPDVHVDDDRRRIVMYFHGLDAFGVQVTRAAVSTNGVNFVAAPEILGASYFRAFRHDGWTYAMAMPGQFYRSRDPLSGFEAGPRLFDRDMRHAALRVEDGALEVFYTRVGDAPERILVSRIDLAGDWMQWTAGAAEEVMRPERPWEGADQPLEPSMRSVAYGRVNQLRDPALFEEDGRLYLLYSVAGEAGIGIAELLRDTASENTGQR